MQKIILGSSFWVLNSAETPYNFYIETTSDLLPVTKGKFPNDSWDYFYLENNLPTN